jgi:hypothetical protein
MGRARKDIMRELHFKYPVSMSMLISPFLCVARGVPRSSPYYPSTLKTATRVYSMPCDGPVFHLNYL